MVIHLWITYGLSIDDDLVAGFNPSEEYEFVSWDYYSQYLEKSKMFQTTNQIYKEEVDFEQCHFGMGISF